MHHMEKQFIIDDLKIGETWRMFKIIGEFVEGIDTLHDLGPAVSFFGSARVKPNDLVYKKYEVPEYNEIEIDIKEKYLANNRKEIYNNFIKQLYSDYSSEIER